MTMHFPILKNDIPDHLHQFSIGNSVSHVFLVYSYLIGYLNYVGFLVVYQLGYLKQFLTQFRKAIDCKFIAVKRFALSNLVSFVFLN